MASYPASQNPQSSRADYTDQQNTTYGFWNPQGQYIFNPALSISGEYTSPATLTTFPIRSTGDASQIRTNTQNRTIFNALNAQQQQVQQNKRSANAPLFKSHQEMLSYIQGQYTQPLPGTTNQTIYTVANLFPQ
jgi:hypothetical protein